MKSHTCVIERVHSGGEFSVVAVPRISQASLPLPVGLGVIAQIVLRTAVISMSAMMLLLAAVVVAAYALGLV